MEASLGGLLPMDFMTCAMSEDYNSTIGSVHEDDDPNSSQGSPSSPIIAFTESQHDIGFGHSNNSTGDASSTEDHPNEATPSREYVNRGSELWNHWAWLGGQGKMSLMKCNYCANKQLKNAPKCRRHLIKCPGTPDHIRAFFEKREIEANRVSQVMREIRNKGDKVSRAAAGAHLAIAGKLARGSSNMSSTPMPTKVTTTNTSAHSLLNSSAPASLLATAVTNALNSQPSPEKTMSPAAMVAAAARGDSKIIAAASDLVRRRKRKSNKNSVDNFDLAKSILAPYLAQSTVPPLPASSMMSPQQQQHQQQQQQQQQPSSNNSNYSNKIKSLLVAAGVPSTTITNTSTTANNIGAIAASHASSIADLQLPNLDATTASIPNAAAVAALYQQLLGSLSMSNNSGALESNRSSAANIAAVLNGGLLPAQPTAQSLKRKNSSVVPGRRENLNGSVMNLSTKHGKENMQQAQKNATVVINLDELPTRVNEETMFFNTSVTPPPPLEPARAKKPRKESNILHVERPSVQGNRGIKVQKVRKSSMTNAAPTAIYNGQLESNSTELNDLLASAFLSSGYDFDFVKNPFFQQFVNKLTEQTELNYRVPSSEELYTANLTNLARKFDAETAKMLSEADSVVVSFDDISPTCHTSNVINTAATSETTINVNLLITEEEKSMPLFFKRFDLSDNVKDLNQHIDSTIQKIQPDRIYAAVLPYQNGAVSDLISSYVKCHHAHIVPLTNSYQLFDHLLVDLSRLDDIRQLLDQCTAMFEVFVQYFDNSEENNLLWSKVFESEHLKMYQHLMQSGNESKLKGCRFWFSIHLMLHWFLVAKDDLPHRISQAENDILQKLNSVMEKVNLDSDEIAKFFDKIDALFHFITPFILAIHRIQFESSVISDIIKVYYDLRAAFIDNDIMENMNFVCETEESRASLDAILTKYIQDENFSDFYFLAYYLDPRYKQDKQIDENEDLMRRVFEALFQYANSLGCNDQADQEECSNMSSSISDALNDFRNDHKIFSGSFLPRTPNQYWKALSRFHFRGLPQLAFCASRLLSISTSALMLSNESVYSGDATALNRSEKLHGILKTQVDSQFVEQLMPVTNFLVRGINGSNGASSCDSMEVSLSRESIAQTVSNVIKTLDAFDSFLTSQPRPPTQTSSSPMTSNDSSSSSADAIESTSITDTLSEGVKLE